LKLTNASTLVFPLAGAVALAAACRPGAGPAAVPLYPNAAATRLPSAQVALVSGPIAKIDDKDLENQAGGFELLPGCHLVELQRQLVDDSYALTGGTYWSGQFPKTVYAIRMKAGARYVIRRDIVSDGQVGRVVLSAQEQAPNGMTVDLAPVQSVEEVKACQEWEHTTLGR
jgi:hypothetical protein